MEDYKSYLLFIQRQLIFADVTLDTEESYEFKTKLYEKLINESPQILDDLILAFN